MSIDVRHISQCENYPKSSLMGIRENNIHTYIYIYIYIYNINSKSGKKGLWSTRTSL